MLSKVAKLVDSYLQEIARDVNLTVSKFVELAETIPDTSRICHDDLYNAIDVYLQVKANKKLVYILRETSNTLVTYCRYIRRLKSVRERGCAESWTARNYQ